MDIVFPHIAQLRFTWICENGSAAIFPDFLKPH